MKKYLNQLCKEATKIILENKQTTICILVGLAVVYCLLRLGVKFDEVHEKLDVIIGMLK